MVDGNVDRRVHASIGERPSAVERLNSSLKSVMKKMRAGVAALGLLAAAPAVAQDAVEIDRSGEVDAGVGKEDVKMAGPIPNQGLGEISARDLMAHGEEFPPSTRGLQTMQEAADGVRSRVYPVLRQTASEREEASYFRMIEQRFLQFESYLTPERLSEVRSAMDTAKKIVELSDGLADAELAAALHALKRAKVYLALVLDLEKELPEMGMDELAEFDKKGQPDLVDAPKSKEWAMAMHQERLRDAMQNYHVQLDDRVAAYAAREGKFPDESTDLKGYVPLRLEASHKHDVDKVLDEVKAPKGTRDEMRMELSRDLEAVTTLWKTLDQGRYDIMQAAGRRFLPETMNWAAYTGRPESLDKIAGAAVASAPSAAADSTDSAPDVLPESFAVFSPEFKLRLKPDSGAITGFAYVDGEGRKFPIHSSQKDGEEVLLSYTFFDDEPLVRQQFLVDATKHSDAVDLQIKGQIDERGEAHVRLYQKALRHLDGLGLHLRPRSMSSAYTLVLSGHPDLSIDLAIAKDHPDKFFFRFYKDGRFLGTTGWIDYSSDKEAILTEVESHLPGVVEETEAP